MAKELNYYKTKLTALCNALFETLKEMEAADSPLTKTPSSPRQRINRKNARVSKYATMYAVGSITKPKELRKTK
ncbi:hypothetical protein V9K67_17435 [Paraflavisolibacter sp. H34]|uniref:hypothetical protein n=1 Tax=Huijunlia imazamoxiresistens TaxID=3127457 RepID=UPI0030186202